MSIRSPITNDLYLSGKVRRWHTHHRYSQTVADHSWGVAVILLALDKNVSREALIAALFHDSNEIATGDAPSYAKDAYYHRWAAVVASEWESRNLPEVAIRAMLKLSQRELSLISLADALEALHFIEVQDDHSTVASNAHQFLKAKVARLSKELDLGDQLELPL